VARDYRLGRGAGEVRPLTSRIALEAQATEYNFHAYEQGGLVYGPHSVTQRFDATKGKWTAISERDTSKERTLEWRRANGC
jgi:hypothetical protein